MVLDLVNKGGWEPIAGQKGQVGPPGLRRKRRGWKKDGYFSVRLGKEKEETIMSDLGEARTTASAYGGLPSQLVTSYRLADKSGAGDSVSRDCASWQAVK